MPHICLDIVAQFPGDGDSDWLVDKHTSGRARVSLGVSIQAFGGCQPHDAGPLAGTGHQGRLPPSPSTPWSPVNTEVAPGKRVGMGKRMREPDITL